MNDKNTRNIASDNYRQTIRIQTNPETKRLSHE